MGDRRRRQWLPLSSEIPFDRTSAHLLDKFGPAGLAVWFCYLTACKRAPTQGTFRYTSESEAWQLLGIDPTTVAFTLGEFFKTTGSLKKTRKTTRGRVTNIECRVWGEWQNKRPRDIAESQTPRSEQQNTGHNTNRKQAPDSDNDNERDKDANGQTVGSLKQWRTAVVGRGLGDMSRQQEAQAIVTVQAAGATIPSVEAGEWDNVITALVNKTGKGVPDHGS